MAHDFHWMDGVGEASAVGRFFGTHRAALLDAVHVASVGSAGVALAFRAGRAPVGNVSPGARSDARGPCLSCTMQNGSERG